MRNDRLSFVFKKEITPFLKALAKSKHMTMSEFIQTCMISEILDNLEVFTEEEKDNLYHIIPKHLHR